MKGSFLTCPHCKHDTHVGHFEWLALVCINCKKEVKLGEWLVSIDQAVQLRLHLTGGILPVNEHLVSLKPGTGIEYLQRQPTSK